MVTRDTRYTTMPAQQTPTAPMVMPVCRPPAVGSCVSSRSRATRTTAAGRALGDEILDYLVIIAASPTGRSFGRLPQAAPAMT